MLAEAFPNTIQGYGETMRSGKDASFGRERLGLGGRNRRKPLLAGLGWAGENNEEHVLAGSDRTL